MVYGDFTSMKSAIASSPASNSGPASRLPWAGSALMTASQLLASSRPASTDAACPVKMSTTCGSNWVPRRCLATATAASVPPARWKTSTTSASATSREVRRICSPLAPLGTPLPSQRSKVCSTLSLTRWGRPSRSPRPSAASQWFSIMASATRRPAPAEMPKDEQRLSGDRAEVGVPEVGLQGHLVAEPLRLLVGVDVAAHPGQQGRVVHDLPVGFVQAHPLGQPQRDQALAQDVFHRLAHAQVGAERQHAEQFGQADVRAGGLGHSEEYKPEPCARQQVRAI